MNYELGVLEASIEEDLREVDSIINYMDMLNNNDISIESFVELVDVSLEGRKFELLKAYIERIYTTLMSILTRIINFIRQTWKRIKLGIKDDKEVEALKELLKDTDDKKLNPEKSLRKLVNNHIAYVSLKSKNKILGKSEAKNAIMLAKESRKKMLEGEPFRFSLGFSLSSSEIERDFNFNTDISKFEDDFEFLSVKGKNIHLFAKIKGEAKYGTGYKVISASVKTTLLDKSKNLIKRHLTRKSIIDDLENMVSIDELYVIIVDGLFGEISAIRQDLESSRIRMIKDAKQNGDSEIHRKNLQAHSQAARQITAISKALMYIGNGLIYDREIRIKFAKELLKQTDIEN